VPRATTRVEIAIQLGVYDYGLGVPFDPAAPSSTSNSVVSVELDDSLGGTHVATIYFHADGALSFSWHAMVDGGDISGGTSGVAIEIDAGTLQCDTTGRLTSIGPAGGGSWDFREATPGQTVSWSFAGVPGSDGTWIPSRCAGTYSVLAIAQDGQSW
jgi:flagellar hook protein FlgE